MTRDELERVERRRWTATPSRSAWPARGCRRGACRRGRPRMRCPAAGARRSRRRRPRGPGRASPPRPCPRSLAPVAGVDVAARAHDRVGSTCRRWRRRRRRTCLMVSVRTSVPAMKATPRMTATRGEEEAGLVGPDGVEDEREHDQPPRDLHAVEHGIGRGVGELVDDAAVGEEHRPVGVGRGDRVVRDHHDGLAELADGRAHEREDLGARAGVEVAGGLVGEDDLAAGWRAPGRPRRAAADHRRAPTAGARGGARDRRSRRRASTHAASGLRPGEPHRQRDVLRRGQRRDQVERLEHEADPVAPQLGELLLGERAEVGVADPDGAVGERVEAGEGVHERRLARARRAHDRGEAAGGEVDGDAVEGPDLGLALAVHLDGVDGPGGHGRIRCREAPALDCG